MNGMFVDLVCTLEISTNPSRAYFWPAVNKRPGYFLTRPEDIFFFDPKEKIEKSEIFKGNFPNTNQRWLTWPDPSSKKLTPLRSNFFDPSLLQSIVEMGPDLARLYYRPALNKRPTHLWPDPMRFCLNQREKIEKFVWPNPSNKKLTRPD